MEAGLGYCCPFDHGSWEAHGTSVPVKLLLDLFWSWAAKAKPKLPSEEKMAVQVFTHTVYEATMYKVNRFMPKTNFNVAQ